MLVLFTNSSMVLEVRAAAVSRYRYSNVLEVTTSETKTCVLLIAQFRTTKLWPPGIFPGDNFLISQGFRHTNEIHRFRF